MAVGIREREFRELVSFRGLRAAWFTTSSPAALSFVSTSSNSWMRITGADRCSGGCAGNSMPVTCVSASARTSVELSSVQKCSFACGGMRNTG